MDDNPVIWFEIYVQDMNRAKSFYQSVFGTELERLDTPDLEMWSFPMKTGKPGSAGALVQANGVTSGGNSTLVYFRSPDCAIEAAKVTKAGGRLHREKMSIGKYGFVALAYDTEGNLFGIHSMH
jgi:predicted enzyme related to lactoylglutathione lyase